MNTKKIFLVLISLIFVLHAKSQNCSLNAGVPQTICSSSTLTLTGDYSGLFVSPRVTTWSLFSGPGGSTIASPNSLVTTVSGLVAGTYVFRLSGTCEDGSLVYNDVTITVTSGPTANAGSDFSKLCAGSYYFTGSALNAGETGAWTKVSGPTLTVTTPTSPVSKFTTPNNTAGTSVYRWTVTKNGCSVSDDVNVELLGTPTTISAGSNSTLSACYTGTTSKALGASFANGTNGVWSVVSGPNTPAFSNVNAYNATVSNLVQGTYVLRWTVTGETCGNGSADVILTVPAPVGALTAASSTYNGQTSGSFCAGYPATVTLVGKTPLANETVTWTYATTPTGGPATLSATNTPTITVTGLDNNYDYTFSYSISNGTCSTSSPTTVKLYKSSTLSITATKPLVVGCGVTTASIPFNTSNGGTVQYSVISGPVTATIPTIPSTYATATNPLNLTGLTVAGTYLVRLRKNPPTNSNCPIIYDEIKIVVAQAPSVSNAGSGQNLACNTTSTELVGNTPTSGTGYWSQVSGPSTVSIPSPALPRSPISGLVSGSYVFRWMISSYPGSGCGSNQNDVTVTVSSQTPTTADAGLDRSVCNNTPLTLNGNTPASGETGTWSVSPSTGISFSNTHSPNAIVTGLAASTAYTFTWRINNACGSTTDNVVITTTALAGPVAADAGADQCLALGTTTATLSGNSPGLGTGSWAQLTGPNSAVIATPASNTTSVSGLVQGTYTFEWTINRNACTFTKDTVMVTISGATTTANAGVDQDVCGTSTSLSANAPAANETGTWTQIVGNGGVVISNIHSPTPTVSNLTAGLYTFRWTISNSACASSYDDVVINAYTPPSAAQVGNSVFNVCNTTSATMNAVAPVVGTGYWTIIAGDGAATITNPLSPTTTITGLNYGVYILRWSVANGLACVNSTDVTLYVSPTISAGSTQNLCGQYSTILMGNAYSNGTWTWVSGPSVVDPVTITNTSSASVSGLIAGTYVFRYTVAALGTCTSKSATVTINVVNAPTAASAGTDLDLCDQTGWTMSANTPAAGETGAWTLVSGPNTPTISSASNPLATVTGAVAGLYTYKWTITNSLSATCISEDLVNIRITNSPSTAIAGPNQTHICGSVATMAANAITGGVGTWTKVTGGAATITNANSPNTTITGLVGSANGADYTFRWTASNGTCLPNYSDVALKVYSNPTTPNAGTDQTVCGVTSVTLAGNSIASGTGVWTKESGPTCTITNPALYNTTVTGMSAGTYVFQWTSTASNTCSLSDQVVVTVLSQPTTANAGADFHVCLSSPLNLTGNTPTVGTGLWTQTSGTALTISSPTAPTTAILGGVAGNTYVFRWTISNGVCTSSYDEVAVTIDALPTMANAGINQSVFGTSVTMTANAATVGSGLWTKVSGPATAVITTPTSPTTTITGLSAGTYVFRWTITNGLCSSSDEITIVSNGTSCVISNKNIQPKLN